MKTSNNTRESKTTTVKSLFSKGSAIVCGLALISLTVNAQSLWEKFSDYAFSAKMAMTTASNFEYQSTAKPLVTELASQTLSEIALSVEVADKEASIEIENWMTKELNFVTNYELTKTDAEDALRVESWMLESKNFSSTTLEINNELEDALEIEPWMTDENNFKSLQNNNIDEPAMQIESWMINNINFETNTLTNEYLENEPLQLEAWMTNNQIWGF